MAVRTSTEHLPGLSLIAAEEVGLFTAAKAGKVGLARYSITKIFHELKVGETYGK